MATANKKLRITKPRRTLVASVENKGSVTLVDLYACPVVKNGYKFKTEDGKHCDLCGAQKSAHDDAILAYQMSLESAAKEGVMEFSRLNTPGASTSGSASLPTVAGPGGGSNLPRESEPRTEESQDSKTEPSIDINLIDGLFYDDVKEALHRDSLRMATIEVTHEDGTTYEIETVEKCRVPDYPTHEASRADGELAVDVLGRPLAASIGFNTTTFRSSGTKAGIDTSVVTPPPLPKPNPTAQVIAATKRALRIVPRVPAPPPIGGLAAPPAPTPIRNPLNTLPSDELTNTVGPALEETVSLNPIPRSWVTRDTPSNQLEMNGMTRADMDKCALLDGHILTQDQTRKMLIASGVPKLLSFLNWQSNAVYSPVATVDQRLVPDTNVRRVEKRLRIRRVLFPNWNLIRKTSWLAFYSVLSMLLFPCVGTIRSLSRTVPSFCVVTIDDRSRFEICPMQESIVQGVGVLLYLLICYPLYLALFSFLDQIHRGFLLKISYVPHIISSLQKDAGFKSTWESEKANVSSRIRRLAALPIADRDSVVLINGSCLAYQAMFEPDSFLSTDTQSTLILTPPTGRCLH